MAAVQYLLHTKSWSFTSTWASLALRGESLSAVGEQAGCSEGTSFALVSSIMHAALTISRCHGMRTKACQEETMRYTSKLFLWFRVNTSTVQPNEMSPVSSPYFTVVPCKQYCKNNYRVAVCSCSFFMLPITFLTLSEKGFHGPHFQAG